MAHNPFPPRLADIYAAKRQEEIAQRAQQQGAPQPSVPAPDDAQPAQSGATQRPVRLADVFAAKKAGQL